MKFRHGPASLLALFMVVAALLLAPKLPVDTTGAALGPSLDSEKKKGEQLVQTLGSGVRELGFAEAMGPLAPVALSPFFALTTLSGASLLADNDWVPVPDALKNNVLLDGSSPLNNGFVFTGLLGLTVLTALPKLTKVTKPVAQVIDQVEAHSGIIAVVAVQYLSRMDAPAGDGQPVAIIVNAGIISFSYATLIAVMSAINVFVINMVKYFFEMLIFLSPFPTVDAIFEAANKSFAAFLLAVYVFNPWLAMVLNLVIFSISLIIFAWAYRRVIYMRSIFADPMLGWLGDKFAGRRRVTLTSRRLTGSLASALPDPEMVLKAFVGKGCDGIKRKSRGLLVKSGGRLYFAKRRLFRSPQLVELSGGGRQAGIDRGFLSNTIAFTDGQDDVVASVLLTRRYNPLLPAIGAALGTSVAPVVDEALPTAAGVMAVPRSIGSAVKGDGRDSLRAELA